jgi:hypothetical protein
VKQPNDNRFNVGYFRGTNGLTATMMIKTTSTSPKGPGTVRLWVKNPGLKRASGTAGFCGIAWFQVWKKVKGEGFIVNFIVMNFRGQSRRISAIGWFGRKDRKE